VIIAIKPKIKILFTDYEQAAKADELLNKKLILISRIMSLAKFLKRVLQYIIFANSSDKESKIGILMGRKAI
jgi:hypothetical protein